VSDSIDTRTGWMSNDVLNDVRDRVPLVYVDAVPVRVDEAGNVTHVGMLLRQAADGSISRMVVSGRVMLNERIREALIRHLEKDLGPLALPCSSRAGTVHRRRIFPGPDREWLPRSASPRGVACLCGARVGGVSANAASVGAHVVHAR